MRQQTPSMLLSVYTGRARGSCGQVWRILCSAGVMCYLIVIMGPVASGNHTTLPGAHNLHPAQESDGGPFTRQLEAINRYRSPHSRFHQEDEAEPVEKDPAALLPSGYSSPVPGDQPEVSLPIVSTGRHHVSVDPVTAQASAETHLHLGWRFLLDGRPQAAMAAYREALRHYPDSAQAYMGMGMTLKSTGKPQQALLAIQQALDLNPQLSSALVHLGYLYANGHVGRADRGKARRLFTQASRLGDPFADIALQELNARPTSLF